MADRAERRRDPADPFDGLDLSDPLGAREEVQRRMGETAAASEVLAQLVELAGAELAAAEQRSAAANEWLETARSEAAAARATRPRAPRTVPPQPNARRRRRVMRRALRSWTPT